MRRGLTPLKLDIMRLKEGTIQGSSSFSLVEKLKAIKLRLKEWKGESFGNVDLKKKGDLKKQGALNSIAGSKEKNTKKMHAAWRDILETNV